MKALAVLLLLCLSKQEAHDKWPKRHLYWHTENRCWDATPGERWRYQRAQAKEPSPPPTPVPTPSKIRNWPEDWCCWPDLSELKEQLRGLIGVQK